MEIKYPFIWTAYFKKGEPICQFDFETGEENPYQLVKDRFEDLIYFILWNKDKMFKVDLDEGIICSNTGEILYCAKDRKNKPELIIWRRIRDIITTIGLKVIEIKTQMIFRFGFKYMDLNDNTREIIFEIDEKGNLLGE